MFNRFLTLRKRRAQEYLRRLYKSPAWTNGEDRTDLVMRMMPAS